MRRVLNRKHHHKPETFSLSDLRWTASPTGDLYYTVPRLPRVYDASVMRVFLWVNTGEVGSYWVVVHPSPDSVQYRVLYKGQDTEMLERIVNTYLMGG